MKKISTISLAICFILSLFILKTQAENSPAPGQKPKTGDFVTLEISYSIPVNGKDSTLFDSKHQKNGAPVKFKLPPSDFKGDLYEAIGTLSEGDSGVFKINADSVFLKMFKMQQIPKMIEPGSFLTFHVKLLKVENTENLKATEMTNLQKYLKDNNITVPPTKSGVYIVEQKKGEGPKIDTGMYVRLQFVISLIDGTPLFNSYEREKPLEFKYGKKFDTPGVDEAIGTMSKGTKALVIVPSAMAFGDQGQGNLVPPYSTLVYNVEILDVISKEQYEKEQADLKLKKEQELETAKKEEKIKMDEYLKTNTIKEKPTESGLIYVEKIKGKGARAEAGKTVKVHYTGRLLDGTKFDSSVDRNEPFEFVLGQGQVIKGWDEGIALMNVGGKATLIIPSSLGYGSQDMGAIPPFSTLVFDVELLDVK
jgi:FKBP-type peptidyl-prolyl cis-trans isomerase FkpA